MLTSINLYILKTYPEVAKDPRCLLAGDRKLAAAGRSQPQFRPVPRLLPQSSHRYMSCLFIDLNLFIELPCSERNAMFVKIHRSY